MRKKQIYKLADKIANLEIAITNPDISQDEKSKVEKEIMKYAGMLAAMPNGLEVMSQIDGIIQKKLEKK
ncbi:MAG: hypothetical protein IKY94_15995 [Lachnospiraceae bacterium]|jgi:hypothetical protein|nr:hypothetical protein [Lachnospiraceae bacterium]